MNAEFQRIARRDKKAFLSDQCKEIKENNRMVKTRRLFKKIRDTKGTFHAKMGSIKDQKGMDLTEAEDVKILTCFIGNMGLLCTPCRGIRPHLSPKGKSHVFSRVAV